MVLWQSEVLTELNNRRSLNLSLYCSEKYFYMTILISFTSGTTTLIWKCDSVVYYWLLLFCYSFLTAPSEGPNGLSFQEVNQTTYNISWDPLAREYSNGIIIGHEIKREKASTEARSKPSIGDTTYSNSANNFKFALVTGFQPGCIYRISVRAFTSAGGGPFGENKTLKISSKSISSTI